MERGALVSTLFDRITELMLLDARRWIGSGRWLPRRLRELSQERTDLLSIPLLANDHDSFAAQVEAELERAGGRMQAGFAR